MFRPPPPTPTDRSPSLLPSLGRFLAPYRWLCNLISSGAFILDRVTLSVLSRSFAGRFIITGIKSWEREGWRRNRLPIGLSFPLFFTCKINFDRSIGEILKGYCNKFVPDRLKSIAFSNHGFVIKRVNCFKEETFFSFSFAWIFIFQARFRNLSSIRYHYLHN